MSTPIAPTVTFEANPYPTGIGSAGQFDMESLIETIRQQHNLIQAGDTTFPWQLLDDVSSTARYRIGSRGRFFHPDHGIIYARYMRFASTVIADTGIPVGLNKTPTQGFRWGANMDFALSGNDLTVGLAAASVNPSAGQFSWVIDEGINIRSVTFAGVSAPTLGTDLKWNATGQVDAGSGRTLGKLMSVTGIVSAGVNLWTIPPGAILVGWR